MQKALRHLCTGRTTIVIAHRLTTIRHADCIHVVDDGMIIESGDEDALLARKGRYETFFRLQFGAQGEAQAVVEPRDVPIELGAPHPVASTA